MHIWHWHVSYININACVCIALCVEVPVDDSWVPGHGVYYVCSDNEEESMRVLLQCCPGHVPCIEWTSEWWYKDASTSNSTYQKYPQVEQSRTAWVYAINTDHPITQSHHSITSIYV